MFILKETARGYANDTADFQPPAWHTGADGSRVVVLEIQDAPVIGGQVGNSGMAVAQIAVAAEHLAAVKKILNL